MNRKLLLISNSTNPGEDYLGWPLSFIREFTGKHNVKRWLFVPYAGVTIGWDDYEARVQAVFSTLGCSIESVHRKENPLQAAIEAEGIAVGGGNTFSLVYWLHRTGLMQAIRERALAGVPYMGWSAGSNVACPALKTTNDMPIIEPESFSCMGLIPFQINPHYLDANPVNHGGETREQRILEFIAANPGMYVAGLRESTLLEVEGDQMELKGRHPLRIFRFGTEPREIQAGENLSFLLNTLI